jgi:hypothetical protein
VTMMTTTTSFSSSSDCWWRNLARWFVCLAKLI